MSYDELWCKGPTITQSENVFRLGSDSVLLSAFAKEGRAKKACDLGCGSGIISIYLAFNNKSLTVDAIDISETAAEITQINVDLNGLSDRINVKCSDIRDHRELFAAGSYDLVVTNPPYFAQASGKSAKTLPIATARDERECALSDIVEAAAYLTRWGGRFAIVYRPERLNELFCAMTALGLEPKRLRMVQYMAGTAPSLVLVEGRRGGKPGLKIEPPLIMALDDGSDSAEIKKIYHRK